MTSNTGLSLKGLRKILFGYFAIVAVLVAKESLYNWLSTRGLPVYSRQNQFAPTGDEVAWFNKVKGSCDSLRVEAAIAQSPAPETLIGNSFKAACYGMAGKIDRSFAIVDSLSPADRDYASSIIFQIAHPIADSGDDRSAGPMMELVIKYQPQNYMALYHAGMSQYILGDKEKSRESLKRFLALYNNGDGWTQRGQRVLHAIETNSPLALETVKGFSMH